MQIALALENGFFSHIHSGNNIINALFKIAFRNIPTDFKECNVILRESFFGNTECGSGNNVFVAFFPYFGNGVM